MLLLRGVRAASTAAAGAARSVSIRLNPVAALSSSPSPGGRRKKGQRRGQPEPPAPAPPQPVREAPGKKKPSARPAEGKKNRAAVEVRGPPRLDGQAGKGTQQPPPQEKPKRLVRWKCATGCGACCKLDKGPDFPTPDEIFADHPDHLEVYKSMIGEDGWCINYDKPTRTCNIYQDRPFFCRVEPKVFDEFFGVARNRFDREACSACVDNIKMVYGEESTELKNFKRVIREESNKAEASRNQDKLLELDT
ncbi:hypothetical protein EJB05_06521 [Eragrostis curvula]|uniref:Zinc/iron-chelating domain-containing protein n=1 Tax=Eragrostis curvula TaxID=38414 RepID=A0A5J9WGG2_9POAL|nr:hypothetical protein EJB05_06521 [Eragrostis curvula]